VIRATGLTLRRGVKVLLDEADFVINPGERVGIVGKNGAGKSTLFSLLQGRLDADAGTLDFVGDEREFFSRTPATEDLRSEHTGMGRELFAGFRALVGTADHGASVFG